MRALLVQQYLQDAFLREKNLTFISETEKSDILQKAHSLIIFSLGDKVLREIAKEEMKAWVWLKLEILYMTKSLAN